jgi:hypothetical protein
MYLLMVLYRQQNTCPCYMTTDKVRAKELQSFDFETKTVLSTFQELLSPI